MAGPESEEVLAKNDEQNVFFNRSGLMVNPEMSAEMIQVPKEIAPALAESTELFVERAGYLEEASPIGSYPAVVNGGDTADAEQLAVLLDKLGERLAFERQGTRLYQSFIRKLEAMPLGDENGPSPEDLRHICDEELEHFRLLQKAIIALGGDATVQTPSADVAGVLSHGVLQVVCDPRTTIAQTLQAMLTAELADNDGWQMLQELAGQLGHRELESQCEKAFEEEQEHLENVRAWLANITVASAVGEEALEEEANENETEKDEQSSPSRTKLSSKSTSKRRKKRK